MNLAEENPALLRRWAIAVGAGVGSLHGFLLYAGHVPALRHLFGDEGLYLSAARDLVATGRMHLDVLWPPLYAWFTAIFVWLGDDSLLMLQLAQTGLLVASALCLSIVTFELLESLVAARLVGGLMLLYPPLVGFAHDVRPEVLGLFLLLAPLAIFLRAPLRPGPMSVAGVLLGLGLMTKLVVLPFVPVLVWPLLRYRGKAGRAGGAIALVAVCTTVGVLSPLLRADEPSSPTATLAFNFWLGMKDVSRRSFGDNVAGDEYRAYQASASTPELREQLLSEKIRRRLGSRSAAHLLSEQLGKQYFRLLDPESFLTAQLPGGSLARRHCAYAGVGETMATVLRGFSYVLHGLVLVGAALGTFALPWSRSAPLKRSWFVVLGLFVAYNFTLFLWVHAVSRYIVPVLPVFFLLTSALAIDSGPVAGRGGLARCAAAFGVGTVTRCLRVAMVLFILLVAFAVPMGIVDARVDPTLTR